MKTKTRRKRPSIVFHDGKPSAVILDIDEYQEMLEQLDDAEDVKRLEEMRKTPLRFRKLSESMILQR